jgi:hypothetical protein
MVQNDDDKKNLGEVAEISRGVRVVRSLLTERGGYPVYQNSMKALGYFDKKICEIIMNIYLLCVNKKYNTFHKFNVN